MKAKEQALKAYPKMSRITEPEGTLIGDGNAEKREGFVEGYTQAEKDIALTWQDIQRIIKIADQMVDEDEDGRLLTMSEEDYYKELLDRYMETKKE